MKAVRPKLADLFALIGGLLLTSIMCRASAPAPETCAGTLDPSFYYGPTIRPTFMERDGDKMVVGHFQGVVRLFSSGAIDASLSGDTSTGTSSPVYAGKKDAQGRWIFGGYFNQFNGEPRQSLARLKADGTLDPTFNPASAPLDTLPYILSVNLQTDGKIIVAGSFTNIAGADRFLIARLNEDGTLDPSFDAGITFSGIVHATAIQPDGKIIVGGSFLHFPDAPFLARLNANGSLDTTFKAPAFINYDVYGITLLPGGKILVNGLFGDWEHPENPRYLARLNADGSNDTTFTPDLDGAVKTVALQADGRILIGGYFREPDGLHHHLAARLLANGRVDPSFESGLQMLNGCGSEETVTAIALDSNNRVTVGGSFFEVNGLPRNGLVRLYNDGERCAGLLGFEMGNYVLTEADTNLQIKVIRTGDDLGPVSVRVTVDPNGSAGALDFVSIETNLYFASGVSTQSFSIRVLNDPQIEHGEYFTLRLNPPTGGAGLRNPAYSVVTIVDDESIHLPGALDLSFIPHIHEGSITDLKLQPDGKILITGEFEEIDGEPRHGVARLNADGTLDRTFDYTGDAIFANELSLAGDKIYMLAARDGKDVVVRLNSNGSVDPGFTSPTFSVRNGSYLNLTALLALPDGKLLVSGAFYLVNDSPRDGLVRLNSDGSIDGTFVGSLDGAVTDAAYALHRLDDGSLLVGGVISRADSANPAALMHLSENGARLNDFKLPQNLSRYSLTYAIARQPDGKIVIAGTFYPPTGGQIQLFRFNTDGSLDASFQPANPIHSETVGLAIQEDGKILTGSVTRLHPDGSIDSRYFPGEAFYGVYDMALQPNGDLLIAGSFFTVNQAPVFGLARLKGGSYVGPGGFELVPPSAVQESADVIKVGVRRTLGSVGAASVRVRTRVDSATAGNDYIETSQVVSFADGESAVKEVEIPILDDVLFEGEESFRVELIAETPDTILGPGEVEVTATIIDDESAFVFPIAEYQAVEGQPHIKISVQRSGAYVGPVSVDLKLEPGTAEEGLDYTPVEMTLDFRANEFQKVVQIPILDDVLGEGDETFFVRLSNPGAGLLLPAVPMKLVILDNAAHVRFEVGTTRATQADRVVRLIVRHDRYFLAAMDNPNVRVRYESIGGTAVPGVEFRPISGELSYHVNDFTGKEISVPLLANSIVGPPTTIFLRLTLLSGEAILERKDATIVLYHPSEVKPAGSIDSRFQANIPHPESSIYELARTPDYIYIAGDLRLASGAQTPLLRYRHDGVFDATFAPKLSGYPSVIIGASNGKIYIGGSFDSINDESANGLARLLSNGLTDPTFRAQLPGRMQVHAMAEDADGRIIVVGYVIGVGLNQAYATRLQSDGTQDPTFIPVTSNEPANYSQFNSVAVAAGGKVYIGGSFSGVNGTPRRGLIRVLGDGSIDPTFNVTEVDVSPAYQIIVTAEQKVLVRTYTFIEDLFFTELVRLDSTGSLDATFMPPRDLDSNLANVGVDEAGRIYLVGNFTRIGDAEFKYIARLSKDGVLDHTFLTPGNLNGSIFSVLPSPEGVYIAGGFTEINSQSERFLARLWADSPTSALAIPSLAAGKVTLRFNSVPGPEYLLESTSDFQTWTEVSRGTTTTGNVTVEIPAKTSGAEYYRLR